MSHDDNIVITLTLSAAAPIDSAPAVARLTSWFSWLAPSVGAPIRSDADPSSFVLPFGDEGAISVALRPGPIAPERLRQPYRKVPLWPHEVAMADAPFLVHVEALDTHGNKRRWHVAPLLAACVAAAIADDLQASGVCHVMGWEAAPFVDALRAVEAQAALHAVWAAPSDQHLVVGKLSPGLKLDGTTAPHLDPRRQIAPELVAAATGPLAGYPVYDPPYRANVCQLAPRFIGDRYLAMENFGYFMGQRALRLDSLAAYLRHFGIADLDPASDSCLDAIGRWCDAYLGALTPSWPYEERLYRAFFAHAERWEGDLVGLNVVFDLGIVLGEAVIARNTDRFWNVMGTGRSDTIGPFQGYMIWDINRNKQWFEPISHVHRLFTNNHGQRWWETEPAPCNFRLTAIDRASREARKRALRPGKP
jgi:hypothetical protein